MYLFIIIIFLGLYLWYMEVPRLEVETELQLQAYATATAMADLSLICDLHHSSHNAASLTHWARPGIEPTCSWTQVRFLTHWATMGTSNFFFFLFAYGSSQAQGQPTWATATATLGSLTHWMRPGIKPASSWIPVRFVSTEPHRELPELLIFNFR